MKQEAQEPVPPPAQNTSAAVETVAADQPTKESSTQINSSEADKMKAVPALSVSKSDVNSHETIMEEASSRVTRGKLKKAKSK